MKELQAQERELTGKKAKRLFSDDMIPAVVYNSKGDSSNIKVHQGELERIIRDATTTTIIDLKVGDKSHKALVKEVTRNPRTDLLQHVAFFEIDEKEPMVFEIPVTLQGTSIAVKNNLGVLIQPTATIEIRCTVNDLIPEIVVDISKLEKPGDTITIDEIDIPEGLKLVHEDLGGLAVATITQLQKLVSEEIAEEEAAAAEAAEDEEAAEGEEGAEGEEAAEGGDSEGSEASDEAKEE